MFGLWKRSGNEKEKSKVTDLQHFVPHYGNPSRMSNENRPTPLRERLPSRIDLFADNLKLDIRAHQRTYEGAYTRTAIGCFSFSILIIKLFSKEFLPIGTMYTVYGCLLYFIGV